VFKKRHSTSHGHLADTFLQPLLSPEAVERERGVILREMEEVNKQQEKGSDFDKLHTAYGNNGVDERFWVRRITFDRCRPRRAIETHYNGKPNGDCRAGVDHVSTRGLGSQLCVRIAPNAIRKPIPELEKANVHRI
jgi:hypothetical protein